MKLLRALLWTFPVVCLLLPLAAPAWSGVIVVTSIAESGDTPTPTDNDYTRINDALQAAMDGDVIMLDGTFDWTEVNAAASWALGPDVMAATGDDYWITVPPVNDLTLTAATLGDATIQGPGDVASTDLEGPLLFADGAYQNLEISNLEILDFDMAIGLFFNTTTDFNGALVTGNRIRMATDLPEILMPFTDPVNPARRSRLDALVAPVRETGDTSDTGARAFEGFNEAFQNIGLHFSFGTDQTISNNIIEIPGDGVSDTSDPDPENHLLAASIAMQSNTSGGSVYEGLLIDGNEIRILAAQSADPEFIYGIWENGHAHAANITVSGNRFINLAAGNDPALNVQNAFRVTSHSSLASTVTYEGNEVRGANLGLAQLTGFGGQDFSAHEPIQVIANTFIGNHTAVLVRSLGSDVLRCNRFYGNDMAIGNEGMLEDADALENWFGCNAGPGFGSCDDIDAEVDVAPWITMGLTSDTPTLNSGEQTTITADLQRTSGGGFATCEIPDGAEVAFAGTGGTVMPETATLTDGSAETTFVAGCLDGLATVTGLVDGQIEATFIAVTAVDADNDGVCDDDDICPGFDDNADADADGMPDGCDDCFGDNSSGDGDHDGVCNDVDLCVGNDTSGDGDSDGICADRDCDDADPANPCEVFRDGFEAGDVSVWSTTTP